MSTASATADAARPPRGSWLQPVSTGLLAALVGFASTFTIVLGGLTRVGASAAEAASGLLVICVLQGLLSIGFSLWRREPISIVWSTPGAALMIATGLPSGGYPAAVGAFLFAAGLIAVAGVWRPFGRLVGAIPKNLASAMLGGILLGLCLAPVHAMTEVPALAAPVILSWALAWRFARPFAVPVALTVMVATVIFVIKLPPHAFDGSWARPLFTPPSLVLATLGSLGLPLFIVTMASQNVPGLAVLRANGYAPRVGPIFLGTGLCSGLCALLGGPIMNLAAITAALCAGPDAHPDPARRYWSTVVAGMAYVVLGLGAGAAAVLVAASPPLLIQAVAGLALMGSLAGALAGALSDEAERLPAIVTFAVAASGIAVFGIGAPFWALAAGGVLLALGRYPTGRFAASR
jgi:benzoate membrane transport protein